MAGLQRSAVSFRRQGSSGLVWDDKFLAAEIAKHERSINNNNNNNNEEEEQKIIQEKLDIKQETSDVKLPSSRTIERSRSNGGGQRVNRSGKVSPAIEPPSPRVSACGFCAAFGKPPKNHRKRAGKTRSR